MVAVRYFTSFNTLASVVKRGLRLSFTQEVGSLTCVKVLGVQPSRGVHSGYVDGPKRRYIVACVISVIHKIVAQPRVLG